MNWLKKYALCLLAVTIYFTDGTCVFTNNWTWEYECSLTLKPMVTNTNGIKAPIGISYREYGEGGRKHIIPITAIKEIVED